MSINGSSNGNMNGAVSTSKTTGFGGHTAAPAPFAFGATGAMN